MLIRILGLGSSWWSRCRDSAHQEQAVYYNSTGIRCGGKVRRHWLTPGLLRINGVVDWDFNHCERGIGQTFVCSDLSHAFGGNRLLVKSKTRTVFVDSYLVVATSEQHGFVDLASAAWKSVFARVIAISQLRYTQELMLLMQPGAWIETRKGFWQLQHLSTHNLGLVRVGGPTRELKS